MSIKARGDEPRSAAPEAERFSSRCPVKYCTGQLRGETDEIGRVRYSCDDCERRAKLEHESRFGSYLDRLRAERRDREARILEAAERAVVAHCEICGDDLTPPATRVCPKTECKRAWKAKYQRERFGRAAQTPPPDSLDLFKDFP